MAGESHGSKASFKVGNAGANTLTLVDGGNSVGLDESIDTAEISAFADGSKRYIAGLQDGTFSVNFTYTNANVALLSAIKGLTRAFEYGPQGTTTGLEKCTGSCIMTGLSRSDDMGSATNGSASFQVTGGITVGVF
jgi:hypothetical protein